MRGMMVRPLLRSIAQFETEIRTEWQINGIRNAKARGLNLGHKKDLNEKECLKLRQNRKQGVLLKTLMRE